jgi:hypothetical protein
MDGPPIVEARAVDFHWIPIPSFDEQSLCLFIEPRFAEVPETLVILLHIQPEIPPIVALVNF